MLEISYCSSPRLTQLIENLFFALPHRNARCPCQISGIACSCYSWENSTSCRRSDIRQVCDDCQYMRSSGLTLPISEEFISRGSGHDSLSLELDINYSNLDATATTASATLKTHSAVETTKSYIAPLNFYPHIALSTAPSSTSSRTTTVLPSNPLPTNMTIFPNMTLYSTGAYYSGTKVPCVMSESSDYVWMTGSTGTSAGTLSHCFTGKINGTTWSYRKPGMTVAPTSKPWKSSTKSKAVAHSRSFTPPDGQDSLPTGSRVSVGLPEVSKQPVFSGAKIVDFNISVFAYLVSFAYLLILVSYWRIE